MRIGLYFGSFNPIHNGHLAIARCALKHGNLNQLWFVVSPHNPLKKKGDLINDGMRLEMVQLAIQDTVNILVSDIELSLPKPSYTVHTMEHLHQQYPQHEFVLLMGGDNLSCFHHWKGYQTLIKNYDILVYPRPGFDKSQIAGQNRISIIDAPQMDISSTQIREKLIKSESVSDLIPQCVEQYIRDKKIWR